MGLCAPSLVFPSNTFFYCQDNWFLISLGVIVLLVIAALVSFAVVVHFLSLMEMVEWWNEKKQPEDKAIEKLADRILQLEETIVRYGLHSPKEEIESESEASQ